MNEMRNRVVDLDINDVLPNRFQPRVKFNEDAIIELAESIKEHGIIQPIIVRPIGDKYEIIAGERRYKASILAGKESIPAIITDLNDKDSAEIALIENVQRKNLTPIEEAVSYKKILDMGYLTQEQLALKLGRSQSSIANKMRLLHLSDEVQEALVEEKISERHARSLLKLNSEAKQNEMLSRIINERLTVRKTDEEIDKMINESPVEEVNSAINEGAFVNSNPGFVDVNRIENQAREIPTSVQPESKIDINALLRPDTMRQTHQEQPKQEKDTFGAISSSIFNLFKQDKKEEQPEVKPVEEKPFYSDPYGSFANEEEKPRPTYTFQPLPNLDDVEPVRPVEPVAPVQPVIPQTPVNQPEPISSFKMPDDIAPMPNGNMFNNVAKPEVKQDIEIIDPVMPKIDLSKFNQQSTVGNDVNSFISKPVLAEKKEEVRPVEPVAPVAPVQPVVPQTPAAPVESQVRPEVKPEPIIITDYDRQYDPIMPAQVQRQTRASFQTVLSSIRNATESIERLGYPVDTDEVDLGTEYRVIITIKKDN